MSNNCSLSVTSTMYLHVFHHFDSYNNVNFIKPGSKRIVQHTLYSLALVVSLFVVVCVKTAEKAGGGGGQLLGPEK